MAIKDFYFEGKTLDEAIEKAAAQFDEDKDTLEYELVQAPSKGIFGIGSTAAKIKVSKEVEDEPEEEKAEEPKPVISFEPEKISKKSPSAPAEKKEQPAADLSEFDRKLEPVEDNEDVLAIKKFLMGLLETLEITDGNVNVSIDTESGDYFADVSGSKMGVLIGRRGETLDAVQYLTNLAATRGKEKKVIVDSENYRAKRISTIVALANKTADKAIKYKRNQSLEPMSAYERRIIHTALANREGITTFSVGTEPHRKVVVSYKK